MSSVSLISLKSPSAPRTETPTLLSAASASDISASVVSPSLLRDILEKIVLKALPIWEPDTLVFSAVVDTNAAYFSKLIPASFTTEPEVAIDWEIVSQPFEKSNAISELSFSTVSATCIAWSSDRLNWFKIPWIASAEDEALIPEAEDNNTVGCALFSMELTLSFSFA